MPEKKTKTRLDKLLTDRGLFDSRQKAQASIMAGNVYVDGKEVNKAGSAFSSDVKIEIKGDACPYVSRGGLKLEKALKLFPVDIENKVCIDAGASTGGFTDCLLQNGAGFIYAIDVGYGQFDWNLRNNPKVKVIERTNVRHITPEELYNNEHPSPATVCTIDLSFISVKKVIVNIIKLMPQAQHIILLIKPQFEAGRDEVPKSGVVKSKEVQTSVIQSIIRDFEKFNLYAHNLTYSPVKGPSGNIEFLAYFSNSIPFVPVDSNVIMETVNTAHQELL